MKILSCKDIEPSCDFVARAETVEEVMQQAMEHGQKDHSDKMQAMLQQMSKEEMTQMMQSMIKDEPVSA